MISVYDICDTFKDTPAVVIGNGESRLKFGLFELSGRECIVFGCNALYRDFTPTFLGAVDRGMICELLESNYHLDNYCVFPKTDTPRISRQVKDTSRIIEWTDDRGWSTGPMMVHFACRLGCNPIYLLGFDFSFSRDHTVNNIYKGSKNYASRDSVITPSGNWETQTRFAMKEFPKVKFLQINPSWTVAGIEKVEWRQCLGRLVQFPNFHEQLKIGKILLQTQKKG